MTGNANEYRRPVKPRSPYLQIFSLPGSAAFCAAAAVARMPMAMVSLGIVLALNHLYKDWATGGFMTALYVLCAAVVTPVYARLFDRFGQRSIGLLLTALQTAGFILLPPRRRTACIWLFCSCWLRIWVLPHSPLGPL